VVHTRQVVSKANHIKLFTTMQTRQS